MYSLSRATRKLIFLTIGGCAVLLAQLPSINRDGTLNSASLALNPASGPELAPGGIFTVFGENLAVDTLLASGSPPTDLPCWNHTYNRRGSRTPRFRLSGKHNFPGPGQSGPTYHRPQHPGIHRCDNAAWLQRPHRSAICACGPWTLHTKRHQLRNRLSQQRNTSRVHHPE